MKYLLTSLQKKIVAISPDAFFWTKIFKDPKKFRPEYFVGWARDFSA